MFKTRADKTQVTAEPMSLDLLRKYPSLYRAYMKLENPRLAGLVVFLTGYIFGLSVSVGLGLSILPGLAIGVVTGIGVLVSGSLVSYLVLQTIALSLVAVVSKIVFGLYPAFSIEVETFQMGYLALLIFVPLVALQPRLKISEKVYSSPFLQLFSSAIFGLLVLFLRSRMPSEPRYALSKLYYGEDNAGIVSTLSLSLKNGYEGHVGLFGEFINGAYLFAAGSIQLLTEGANLGLLPALTHYNMTLLFMAWVPLAALCAVTFSGAIRSESKKYATVLFMTSILALLIWPFHHIGHTAVISSGLLAMPLLALTLNRNLAIRGPVLYLSLIAALGFLVGTTWFPLMPFAAATVALVFVSLGFELRKGNRKLLASIVIFSIIVVAIMLPGALDLAITSGDYIGLTGGTRRPGRALFLIWLMLVAIVCWKLMRAKQETGFLGTRLFAATIGLLTASIFYLLVSGFWANEFTSFGYGATKYTLTAIAFSLPVLWLALIDHSKEITINATIAAGIVTVLIVLLTQGDTRRIPEAILLPNSLGPLSSPQPEDFEFANSGVVLALDAALAKGPEHVFCTADYGFPAPGYGQTLDSYFCTRWGQSFTSSDSSPWRFVPLNLQPKSDLEDVREKLAGERVVLIRLTEPNARNPLEQSDTWWYKYTDKSWDIITVTK